MATATTAEIKYSGAGIGSLIFGLFALLLFYVPVIGFTFEIVAIGLGIISIVEVEKGQRTGIGLGLVGLFLGVISLLSTLTVLLIRLGIINIRF